MYKLNNIPLTNYGIIAGRAPGSNIALEGFLDMPKRLGKTFHNWLDEEGYEPYVDAEELFFDGRTISFYGFLQGTDKQNAIAKLQELYTDFGRLTDTITLSSDYGDFDVYLRQQIETEYLGSGWVSLKMVFEEPLITLSAVTVPAPSTINIYHVDFIPFSAFGAFVTVLRDNYNRPELKQANFTSYNQAGYQLTQPGPLDVFLQLYFTATDFATLKQNVETFHTLLASPGIRVLNIDDTERESFAVDGFRVDNLRVMQGAAHCRLSISMLMAFDGKPVVTPWLRDFKNEGVRDSNGNFIQEQLIEDLFLVDTNQVQVLDKTLNPIKLKI